MQPVPITQVILLSVVTLGIYGVVRFYQCWMAYRAMVPQRDSTFEWKFWTWVALSGFGLVTARSLGFLFFIAALPFGAMVLSEVLDVRAEALQSRGLPLALTSKSAHLTLWLVGQVLDFVIVGLVFNIIQAVKFFEDHNTIVAALAARPA